MRKAVGILVLGLGFLLAACGTSGSNSGSGNNDVTVTVTATGASFAAYRTGSGSWQAPADPTSFSFTVTGGGAYDVAVRCGDSVNVYSLTTDDLTSLDASCAAAPTTIAFNVSYDVSGVTGAVAAVLFHKGSGLSPEFGSGTNGTINVAGGVAGTQDLVLIAIDGSTPPNALAAKMYTVTAANGNGIDLTGDPVTGVDAVGTATFPDFSAEVPNSGYAPGWTTLVLTPNGTLLQAGADFGTAGGGSYYTFPFADRYVFTAFAEDPPYALAASFARASGAPTITFSAPINPSASGTPASVTGLTTSNDLVVYSITVAWSAPVMLSATVSKAYLGSAASYTLPDLTPLSGFGDTQPTSGDTVFVTVVAVESNRTLADLMGLGENPTAVLPDGWDLRISQKDLSYAAP